MSLLRLFDQSEKAIHIEANIAILPNISLIKRQSDNQIWSVNRTYHEKHFS